MFLFVFPDPVEYVLAGAGLIDKAARPLPFVFPQGSTPYTDFVAVVGCMLLAPLTSIGHRDHRGDRFSCLLGGTPTLPIPPMTDAVDGVSARSFERISRRSPFPDRLLAVKHEPGGSSSRKLT